MRFGKHVLAGLFCFLLVATVACTQGTAPGAPPAKSPTSPADTAAFMKAADEVLADMSKILSLPVLEPLKKSVRTRDEIHDYLVKSMKEDKDDAKDYADRRVMEDLGLIPKGYPLDQEMLALLTEQIAGLYDSKGREFFIADWTSPEDQRVIMAHELTHALEDQHFHVEKWEDAGKPNDDAVLARDAVLEGSATVSMVDYLIRDTGRTTRDLPDFDPGDMVGDSNDSPEFAKAPLVIRDEMLFPYTSGAGFILKLLKTWNGWPDIHKIFENPPLSTAQIMHPDLYLRGVAPLKVAMPPLAKILPKDWKQLDENVMGEFGFLSILKQFLGEDRAKDLASAWAGDRYAILEHQPDKKQDLLVMRIALKSDADAARFFGGYSETLEMKDDMRTNLLRRPNFFSFDTPDGGVFIRCSGSECLIAEGTTRALFDAMTKSIGWPDGPLPPIDNGTGVLADLHGARPYAAQLYPVHSYSAHSNSVNSYLAACAACRIVPSQTALPVR
jgi:hypothetical protein